VLTALSLAALLTAAPLGNARLDHSSASVTLRLTSYETGKVAVGKRGTFTSAELLYRSAAGDRLELRFLFRGTGELPAKNITSVLAQTKAGGISRWTPAKKTGCRVTLRQATESAVAGKLDCVSPESGEPFEAVFDAKR
jgi:hypothetical protein